MNKLFEEVSRIIGSPLPRRQALKLVGGALAGAALAPLTGWASNAQGQRLPTPYSCPPSNPNVCTGPPFAPTNPQLSRCCAPNTCCNNTVCCPPGYACTSPSSPPYCTPTSPS